MMMNDDSLDKFRDHIEHEFLQCLKKGEDIRWFAYLPQSFLTTFVKGHLYEFLMRETYKRILSGELSSDNFNVYEDPHIKITHLIVESKIVYLNNLLNFFIKNEEYEKCVHIHKLLKEIES